MKQTFLAFCNSFAEILQLPLEIPHKMKEKTQGEIYGIWVYGIYLWFSSYFIIYFTCKLPDFVFKKNSFFHVQIFEGKMKFQHEK